jgi:hypothetical protein
MAHMPNNRVAPISISICRSFLAILTQSCANNAASFIICTMSKKSDNKDERISPLALVAGSLVLIALITFAVLQKKEHQQENDSPEVATSQSIKTEPAPQPERTEPAPAQEPTPETSTQVSFRMPPFLTEAQLTNLQPTRDPMTVNPGAMAAYQVAQQKPTLLAQLPCFCYCDRLGHGSLHDCYVSTHAESCDICLKEALQADQMDKQGIPVAQIREAIVAQFHPRDSEHVH